MMPTQFNHISKSASIKSIKMKKNIYIYLYIQKEKSICFCLNLFGFLTNKDKFPLFRNNNVNLGRGTNAMNS